MNRFLLFALTLGLLACQREGEEILPSPKKEEPVITQKDILRNTDNLKWVALTQDYQVSEDEAKSLALSFAQKAQTSQSLAKGISLYAKGNTLEVETIKAVTKAHHSSFRSIALPQQQDVYIVNFKNNRGYLITSADKRVPGIFAYNDTGHWGDTLSTPGQAFFYEYMLDYIQVYREAFEKKRKELAKEAWNEFTQGYSQKEKDSLYSLYFDKEGNIKKKDVRSSYKMAHYRSDDFDPDDPDCDRGEDYTVYRDWKLISSKDEMLKTEWGQIGEYSNVVKKLPCGNPPVGCVATAVGQILAYYKKPSVFEGRTMHWEEMTSTPYISGLSNNPQAKNDIQYLLAHLGDKKFLDMSYACNESGSNIEKAFETFKKLGYPNIWLKNTINGTSTEINNGNLLYVRGTKKPNTDGHAWVVDGVKRYEAYKLDVIFVGCMRKEYEDSDVFELFHHNFGWGGLSNGWYAETFYSERAKEMFRRYYSSPYPYDIKVISHFVN